MKIGILQKISLLKSFIQVIRNPLETRDFHLAVDQYLDPSIYAEIYSKLNQDNASRNVLEKETRMKEITIEELSKFPPTTLGYAYANYLQQNSLSIAMNELNAIRPTNYLRYREDNYGPIWKVILGLDHSIEGEVALQAFLYAQTHSAISVIYFVLALIHTMLYNPFNLMNLIESFIDGFQRGKKARIIWGVAFENYFGQSLNAIREKCLNPAKLQIASPANSSAAVQIQTH